MKKRRILLTVISVMLILGTVAGIATVFSMGEDYVLTQSALGYMDPTVPGKGKYYSNTDTFTFSDSDLESILFGGFTESSTSVTIMRNTTLFDQDDPASYC